ncbi:hypothetical protein ACFWDI_05935 [Streptomyces sp. NPDC060064]|uniref:hypothetical protein n=1 Tax=Streptomyces sp. NPDC060064 TaxID=3347049 RepID=UPI0036CC99F6
MAAGSDNALPARAQAGSGHAALLVVRRARLRDRHAFRSAHSVSVGSVQCNSQGYHVAFGTASAVATVALKLAAVLLRTPRRTAADAAPDTGPTGVARASEPDGV